MASRLEYWPETELPGIIQGFNQGGGDSQAIASNERTSLHQASLVNMYASAQNANQYHSLLPLIEQKAMGADQIADNQGVCQAAIEYQADKRVSSYAPQAPIDESFDDDTGD
jgi:hypothetical protein